jgi:hypothetical protein
MCSSLIMFGATLPQPAPAVKDMRASLEVRLTALGDKSTDTAPSRAEWLEQKTETEEKEKKKEESETKAGACGGANETRRLAWKQACAIGAGTIREGVYEIPPIRDSFQWGNNLSPYWNGRILAWLGGYEFRCTLPEGSWLQLLPANVSAPPGGGCEESFNTACSLCQQNDWIYPHRCASPQYIIDQMRLEIRQASKD